MKALSKRYGKLKWIDTPFAHRHYGKLKGGLFWPDNSRVYVSTPQAGDPYSKALGSPPSEHD